MLMKPNLSGPLYSNFQRAHVGTTLTGFSGIVPFNKPMAQAPLVPNQYPK